MSLLQRSPHGRDRRPSHGLEGLNLAIRCPKMTDLFHIGIHELSDGKIVVSVEQDDVV